jgi:putative hemolysin
VPFASFPSNRLPGFLANTVNRLLRIDQLEKLYEQARSRTAFFSSLLEELDVEARIAPGDLERIPASGAVIAVSNHPFGILDGALLTQALTRVRADVRVLTNHLLGELPELAPFCIFIDPFDRSESRIANGRALKQAIAHVRGGGLLLIFPAGEVAHFDLKTRAIRDPEWMPTAARLIRITGAKALPILVRGANSLGFQVLGMVHPRLRTAALPAELLNKRGKSVEILVGSSIESARLEAMPEDAEAIQYLRLRSELLGRRGEASAIAPTLSTPVAEAIPAGDLEREIDSLPAEALVEQNRDYCVYLTEAPQIPRVIREIGRLREITFRAAGEGSGRARDLDRFDPHYLHLFIWNRAKREIVGSYRIGDVPSLLRKFGRKGLYTTSLFRFHPLFFAKLGPAFELGRSFVRLEYQKQFAPLLLLWKGISSYVCRRPEYATLIGAVSVSNHYSAASREVIARYFETQMKAVNPTGPFRHGSVWPRRPLKGRTIRDWEVKALCALLPEVEDLSGPIADLEPDGKGIPILVRQYVKLGGKLLAFSVDPTFGNTLDGFVLVDLTQTNPETLARYMGKEQAAGFFGWHSAAARPRVA